MENFIFYAMSDLLFCPKVMVAAYSEPWCSVFIHLVFL